MLLFYTAVRVSELVHIEVGDLDLDACKILSIAAKAPRTAISCFRRASAWCSKATCTPRRAIDIYSRLGGSGRSRHAESGCWVAMEPNAELGIMQSIFRSASRRETLGKHSKGWSPRRWAKNGLDKTAAHSVAYVY